MKKINLIAETAFNHMGSIKKIKELIEKLSNINIKYMTFQILHPESFSTQDYSKYKFSKKVEISYPNWINIYYYCKKHKINFLPCFLDVYSLQQMNHLEYKTIKIHSTDLFNKNLIEKIIDYNPNNLILETQACNLHEIDLALQNFLNYNGNVILFHGFSDYPTKTTDQNLNMLKCLKDRYNVEVGFADHTLSTDVLPMMAISCGANYIEKHITIQRDPNDFDYQVSLNIDEFDELYKNINKFSLALGAKNKYPVKNEIKYKNIIHKKVRVKNEMSANYIIYYDFIDFVRADNGIPSGRIGNYIKRKIKKPISPNSIIEVDDLVRDKITIAIIVRLKSKRLKEKVLKKINGKHLISILIDRLKKVSNDDNEINIVLATSTLKEDKPLIEIAKINNIDYYMGDPENVLDRLVNIAEKYNSSGILRVTGDNICTDIRLSKIIINEFRETNLEYIRTNNIPLGISPEIFSINCLYKIYDNMGNPNKSEYLTIYANQPEPYKVGIIKLSKKYYAFNNKFSIDTIEDYKYLQKFNYFLKKQDKVLTNSDLNDIIEFIKLNPINEKKILEKPFKLPNNKKITYKEFNQYLKENEKKSTILNYRSKYDKK